MFELTLLDHLRLTFGHVVYRHKVHSQLAHSRARKGRWLRALEAALVASAGGFALAGVFGYSRVWVGVSAVLALFALVALLVHLAIDVDGSALVHGACAARLWPLRERYRALMSDLADGAIDVQTARIRRDALIDELTRVYEHAPPADLPAYQTAARAAAAATEGALTDEEIDRFLPTSLRKAGKSEAA
jgi:SMODS and SLOG-associating 2TM effector domain family 4